jgi:hypothetical protein
MTAALEGLDAVVAFVGVVMFAAGFVVGAHWRAAGRRRRPLPLALPGERHRVA